VPGFDGTDCLSQTAEHLVAGALIHVLPRPGHAKVAGQLGTAPLSVGGVQAGGGGAG
jgi:hypothetical protein